MSGKVCYVASRRQHRVDVVVVRFPVRIEAGAAVLLDGDELVEGLPVADNGGFSGGFELRATSFHQVIRLLELVAVACLVVSAAVDEIVEGVISAVA